MIDERLLKEWDWEKNAKEGFYPDKMQPHSNKKVHWKCKLGHEWMSVIEKRTMGQNCPICSNHRLLVGFNDLASQYPDVAKEWDYEANKPLLPNEVVFGCTKIVWWKCSVCGNGWKAKVTERTIRGRNCPKCSLIKKGIERRMAAVSVKGGIQDPLLLSEWNHEKNGDLLPEQFTAKSNKIVWWKCSKCSSEWQAEISNRTNGRGCPYCLNRKIRVGYNDLATTHPQLAQEWDYEKNGELTPQMVTYGSGKKIWWRCPLGHSYQANLLHRAQGTNCPICNAGRQTSFGEQALFYYIKKIFPDAINRYGDIFKNGMELDIYIPCIFLGIEYDGVYWHRDKDERERRKYQICQQNHIRLFRIREAPIDDVYSFLEEPMADRIFQVDNLDERKNLEHLLIDFLREFTHWGRSIPRRYPDVDLRRDEIEIRQQYLMAQQVDSLEKTYPKLVEEWNYEKNAGLLPAMFQPGSSVRVWWKCSICGREWKTSISHRTTGTGCPICYRKNNRGGSHPNAKHVYQYDLEGNFIKEWDCISEAAKKLNLNPSNITSCTQHQRAKVGGFRWENSYSSKLNPIIKKQINRKGKCGKKILQFDREGNFIKEFPTFVEASNELNIDSTTLSKVLHGHGLTAGGFVWKFKGST